MFNKKLNAYKIIFLVFLSIIVFALSCVFPALSALNGVVYADTDELVDSVDLIDAMPHLRIRMYDSYREKNIEIYETDSVGDIIYKITTIPGVTPKSVKQIYEGSGFKWFLKNKLKLLQTVVTERSGAERAILLVTPEEIESLVRDNAEIIKEYTGYELTERDYESVKRFFNDNSGINSYVNSASIQAKTAIFGNFDTSVTLSAIIAAVLILALSIIGLLITKNLCSAFVSAGISVFFAGAVSAAAGVGCNTVIFFSNLDPSNFVKFIAELVATPLIICGGILIGVSALCFIMAVITKKVIYAGGGTPTANNGSFSYEYQTTGFPSDGTVASAGEETADAKRTNEENDNEESGHEEWKRFWTENASEDADGEKK